MYAHRKNAAQRRTVVFHLHIGRRETEFTAELASMHYATAYAVTAPEQPFDRDGGQRIPGPPEAVLPEPLDVPRVEVLVNERAEPGIDVLRSEWLG